MGTQMGKELGRCIVHIYKAGSIEEGVSCLGLSKMGNPVEVTGARPGVKEKSTTEMSSTLQ